MIPPIVNIKAILLFTIFLFGPLILALAGCITRCGGTKDANNYSRGYKDSKGDPISILNPGTGSSSAGGNGDSAGDNNGNNQGNNGGNNNGRNNNPGV